MIWDDQSTGYLIFCPFRATFKFTWDKSLDMDIKAFTLKNVLFLILWGFFKENLPFFRGGGGVYQCSRSVAIMTILWEAIITIMRSRTAIIAAIIRYWLIIMESNYEHIVAIKRSRAAIIAAIIATIIKTDWQLWSPILRKASQLWEIPYNYRK